jgi:ketosteroid isomerase-like protein
MTNQAAPDIAAAFLAAFGTSDLDAALALLDEQATIDVPGDPAVPWTGKRHGHAGALEFFGLLAEHLEAEAFEIDKIVGDDKTAVALGRFRQRVKQSGDTFASEFALRLQANDGRILDYLMLENSWIVSDVFRGAAAVST